MKTLSILAALVVPVMFVLGLVIAGATGEPGAVAVTGGAISLDSVLEETMCVGGGQVGHLTPAKSANAETVVAVVAAGSDENTLAERIALMVALTESGLQNLGPEKGNDGSLGIFQQRVIENWGTAAQEMDLADATAMFIHRLLQVPEWQTIMPWIAAQEVQRSAFAGGSNYKRNWARAGVVLDNVTGCMTSTDCGGGPTGGEPGPPSRHGLPLDYVLPPGTTAPATLELEYAISKLGDAYVWGAAGPDAFDCSGLTMMAWAQAGVTLEHYTVSQESEGTKVPASAIVPGDLVLIPGDDAPGPGEPGHVGIYLGDGLVESAIDPAQGVAVQSWASFVSGGLDAVVDPVPPAASSLTTEPHGS